MTGHGSSGRSPFDQVIRDIADFAVSPAEFSDEAYETARLCLLDSIGCALLALNYPACTKLLGPEIPGDSVKYGARVPGTSFVLPPTKAAFDIGASIRWLDYNDTWLAAEWGHPSDNFGTVLALADWIGNGQLTSLGELKDVTTGRGAAPITVRDVLGWAIKAYEIQGVLALDNAFNRVGIDHVLLVKVASTAVATAMLGGNVAQVCNAVSNAWLEATLRTYRHAPNTGSRKSWAAGDACARAVRLAQMAMAGEMGYPTALSAKGWGFQDVWFGGKEVTLGRSLDSYVMQNILFKISFPAEFHAQTAVEAALALHDEVKHRLDEIERVEITTQEPAIRIIDKQGPLTNPADRDHCIQYMVAVPLVRGRLTADDYEDEVAADPRIDKLRPKMVCIEDARYTREYLEPDKRSIANAVQVYFRDGTATAKIAVEYPIGHRSRRSDGVPLLMEKYRANLGTRFDAGRADAIYSATATDAQSLGQMTASGLVDLLIP